MKQPRITKRYLDKVWQKMQRGKQKTAMPPADTSCPGPFFTDEAYLLYTKNKSRIE